MQKRYAISDIHGNARAFLKLLDHVDPDPEELVILGDLCDRGLETWEVFKECALLLDEGATIIRGNHDQWLQDHIEGRMSLGQFTHESIGGLTTIKSLELAIAKRGEEKVYKKVKKVLDGMQFYLEDDNYIFVHAGLDPRLPYMNQQKPLSLLMGDQSWKNPQLQHPYDQYVVFGHTPTYSIHRDIKEEAATVWMSHRAKKIAIDTGAGFGSRLTMVDLQEGIAYAYDFRKRDIIEYKFKRSDKIGRY